MQPAKRFLKLRGCYPGLILETAFLHRFLIKRQKDFLRKSGRLKSDYPILVS